jgi:hypothetical protein
MCRYGYSTYGAKADSIVLYILFCIFMSSGAGTGQRRDLKGALKVCLLPGLAFPTGLGEGYE